MKQSQTFEQNTTEYIQSKIQFAYSNIPNNPFEFQERCNKEMNIITISDIHMDTKKLDKLKNWQMKFNIEDITDYVFVLGDFDNLDQEKVEKDAKAQIQSEAQITNILVFLEFFHCPILYIPGNHDPMLLYYPINENSNEQLKYSEQFQDIQRLTQHSFNLHKHFYNLAKDLQICGLGGSVPAFQKLINQEQKQPIWNSFPYSSDQQYGQDLHKMIDSQVSEKIQTILLTHIGPDISQTSVYYQEDHRQPIYSGSQELTNIMIDHDKNNIFLNIHGHTHGSQGKCVIKNVQIINVGALQQGEFSKIRLVRDAVSQKWVVQCTQFFNLDSF